MKGKHIKIIVFILLGVTAMVMLFLVAFRFFAPERNIIQDKTGELIVSDLVSTASDPASTLYVSEDGGVTWRGIADARFAAFHLQFDLSASRLLIGTQEQGLWKTDSATFLGVSPITDPDKIIPSESTIFGIMRTIAENSPVYTAVRYEDRGYLLAITKASWREIFFAPLEDRPLRAVSGDPFSRERIAIGAGTGFYISEDAGETWRIAHRFRQDIIHIVAHPHIPGWYFVSTRRGEIFRTSDYGDSWEELTRSFSRMRGSRNNQNIHIDSLTGIVYLTSDHGLLVSWDDGVTWNDIPLIVPPDTLPIIGFAVHPIDFNTLYVSASSQLYTSEDGGKTWRGISFFEKGSIISIAVHPNNANIIVIGFAK
jgi:hypothetical protein